MKRRTFAMLILGLFLLSGCGDGGPKVQKAGKSGTASEKGDVKEY